MENFKNKKTKTERPTLKQELQRAVRIWVDEKRFYGMIGPKGITYQKTITIYESFENLLYRDSNGKLLGVVRYRRYGSMIEEDGQINLKVHPAYWRNGIGTLLLEEALKTWPIDLNKQEYTIFGSHFIEAFKKVHQFDTNGDLIINRTIKQTVLRKELHDLFDLGTFQLPL